MRLPFNFDGSKHASNGWVLIKPENQAISLEFWVKSAVDSSFHGAHRK
jgi:hypothetical protein